MAFCQVDNLSVGLKSVCNSSELAEDYKKVRVEEKIVLDGIAAYDPNGTESARIKMSVNQVLKNLESPCPSGSEECLRNVFVQQIENLKNDLVRVQKEFREAKLIDAMSKNQAIKKQADENAAKIKIMEMQLEQEKNYRLQIYVGIATGAFLIIAALILFANRRTKGNDNKSIGKENVTDGAKWQAPKEQMQDPSGNVEGSMAMEDLKLSSDTTEKTKGGIRLDKETVNGNGAEDINKGTNLNAVAEVIKSYINNTLSESKKNLKFNLIVAVCILALVFGYKIFDASSIGLGSLRIPILSSLTGPSLSGLFDLSIPLEKREQMAHDFVVGKYYFADRSLADMPSISNYNFAADGTYTSSTCTAYGEVSERKFENTGGRWRIKEGRYWNTGTIYYGVILDDLNLSSLLVDRDSGRLNALPYGT